MQIFFKQNLAMLAVPKTGSTAYEMALRGQADIIFAKRRKHMTAGQFERRMAPFLAKMYDLRPELLAVMRNPIDQLGSWYRYRHAEGKAGRATSTQGMSFDDFVLAAISDKPPAFAAVGSQHNFLTMQGDHLPVHHLFAYENQSKLRGFLEDRFEQPLTIPVKNVSPEMPLSLSPEVEKALRQARAKDFALYADLQEAGGYLGPRAD